MKIIVTEFADKLFVRNLIKGLFTIPVNAVYLTSDHQNKYMTMASPPFSARGT